MVTKSEMESLQTKLQLQLSNRNWDISNKRLLGLPQLMPDEVFSSWIMRLIASGKIKKKQLFRAIDLTLPLYLADLNPNLFDIQNLTMRFNLGSTNLLSSAFIEFNNHMELEHSLCLTTDIMHRRPIYRYCPQCFIEDEIPYIRKAWRYAFSYVCAKHGSLLMECCNICGGFIEQNRLKIHSKLLDTINFLSQCQHCNADLTQQKQVHINSSVIDTLIRAQNHMCKLVGNNLCSQIRYKKSYENSLAVYPYMMQIRLINQNTINNIYIGISGSNLFQADDGQVRGLFNKYKLFKSTFWQPSNVIFHSKLLKEINIVRRWMNIQLDFTN